MSETITVTAVAQAPLERVWAAYTTPADICQWNAASDDWHTPSASVDLRPGGRFCSRMEARDGSFGFDFEGEYTEVVHLQRLAYRFGERTATVHFEPVAEGVRVTVVFEPETQHSLEQQREGWQSILQRFARHVKGHLAAE